jgi:putative membrane protein
MEIRKRIRKNPFYLLVSKPGIYIKSLLWNTILIGFFTLIIGTTINYLDININIPPSMHSLVGFVIGLLLVFRTNTSYDRWWEGRKLFSSTSHQIGLMAARMGTIKNNISTPSHIKTQNLIELNNFKKSIEDFILNLSDYLKNGDDDVQSSDFHIKQNGFIEKAMISLDKVNENDFNVVGLYSSLDKMLEYSNQFERIKNTPIPLSYVLHIKMCILIYLLTLPFGMFHELGLFATPVVMLIYYIMGGVEIISTEIENPFADDPNDLPTEQLFEDMLGALKDK